MNDEIKTVYVVGQYIAKNDLGAVWEIEGVFDDKEKAEQACIEKNFFVGPVPMNQIIGGRNVAWPRCYYPKLR